MRINSIRWPYWIILTVLLMITTACSSATQAAPTATPSPTPIPPTATPLPPTPEPTEEAVAETAVEPTEPPIAEEEATPEPSATPTQTPAPEPTATPDPFRTFHIVPEESTALYSVEEEFFNGAVTRLGKELGFFTAVGTTQNIEGQLRLLINEETSAIESVEGQFIVDLRTLQTDDSRRDERIREQHLESNRFPFAEFAITSVEGLPEAYTEGEALQFQLIGEMKIREIAQEVIFETTAVLSDDTIEGTAVATIMMIDFGFDPPEIAGFMKAMDPATIEVEIVARE